MVSPLEKKNVIKVFNNHTFPYRMDIKYNNKLNNDETSVFSCSIDNNDEYVALGCGDNIARIFSLKNGMPSV